MSGYFLKGPQTKILESRTRYSESGKTIVGEHKFSEFLVTIGVVTSSLENFGS